MSIEFSPGQKLWATVGIGMVAFMISTEFYVVGAIIPVLIEYFGTTFPIAQWTILIYTFVLTVFVLGAARLGDIYSKKRLFLSGLLLFTVSSLFCGLAPTIYVLIFFRGLQGLGAVLVWGLRNAIITELFPEEEQGQVLGWVTGLSSLGLAVGPGLGGLLISVGGWRFVFWVNLPIGIIAGLMVAYYLPFSPGPGFKKGFDGVGLLLILLSLSCFVLGITRMQEFGLGDPLELILMVLALLSFVVLIWFESSIEEPILDLGLFQSPKFSLNLLVFGMVYILVGIIQLVLPLFLELGLHYSAPRVGFLLTLLPLASVLVAPISGFLTDRFGNRIVTIMGLFLLTIGCWAATTLNAESTSVGFCIRGIMIELGLIVTVIPLSNTVMELVTFEKLGIASGLLSLSRSLGMVIGTCLFGVLFYFVTFEDVNSLMSTQDTVMSIQLFNIANLPIRTLIMGVDTTFLTMTLMGCVAIVLTVFLGWNWFASPPVPSTLPEVDE
jgi:EmrB/QacA subfamily drug resistance transporter